MSQNLPSAAVVIDALKVKSLACFCTAPIVQEIIASKSIYKMLNSLKLHNL